MDTKFGSGRTRQVYEFMRAHRLMTDLIRKVSDLIDLHWGGIEPSVPFALDLHAQAANATGEFTSHAET